LAFEEDHAAYEERKAKAKVIWKEQYVESLLARKKDGR
jgi:hypothetical protein